MDTRRVLRSLKAPTDDQVHRVIVLSLGYLSPRDLLLGVGLASKELHKLSLADILWAHRLPELEPHWDDAPDPNFPRRATGSRRDHCSFFPATGDDLSACYEQSTRNLYTDLDPQPPERLETSAQLVFADRSNSGGSMGKLFSEHGVCRVLRATSELQDLAHYAAEGVGEQWGIIHHRRRIWVRRPLPLRCEACDISCDSYPAFFAHCATFAHKELLLDEDQRLDAKFCDPRHAVDEFKSLSCVQQYKAVFEFHNFITQHLESELWPEEDNPALEQHMQSYADFANEELEDLKSQGFCSHEVKNNMTIQDAKRGWLEFIMYDFRAGEDDHYVRQVLIHGWEHTNPGGSGSNRQLLGCITGQDFS